jgi:hypothetical protein
MLNFIYVPVYAASLTVISDTMSREKASQASDHSIKFRVATAVNGPTKTITITFPTGFTIGSVDNTDIDLSHGASTGYETEETLGASAASGVWGAVFAGLVLTLTPPTDAGATEITANDYVIVEIGQNATGGAGNAQISNPSAATYVISIAGVFGDTGSFAVAIIADDQVVVSTTIQPYITFTLTTNSVTLKRTGGTLDPDYSNTGFNTGTANTLAANTNGVSGYTISYNGATLTSGANTIAAMAAKAASSTNTEQFGINLKLNTTPATGTEPTGSGTGAPTSDYATQNQYKFVAGAATALASASAPTLSNTYTVTYIVNVTQVTKPGAYSTTITYICTGNF